MKLSKAQIEALANKIVANDNAARDAKKESLKTDANIIRRALAVMDTFKEMQTLAAQSELDIDVRVVGCGSTPDFDDIVESIISKEVGVPKHGYYVNREMMDKITIASIDAADLATLCTTLNITL